MPRHAREPHTISVHDLLEWMAREEWQVMASSSAEPKRLETSHALGCRFRVFHGEKLVYLGAGPSDAVNAYNEIT